MDGLASWVGGDPEEHVVMKPAGEEQRKVNCVEENESRTVLGRGNTEQLLTPQVKPVETGLFECPPAVVTIAPAALRNVCSLKRKLKHTNTFLLSLNSNNTYSREFSPCLQ